MRAFRKLYRLARLLQHLLIGTILTWFFAPPNHEVPDERFDKYIIWWRRRLRNILNVKLTVIGSPPIEPSLWTANHISWIDIILLGGFNRLDFLSKAEVRRWPLMGWLAFRGGTLFVSRGARDSAHQALEQMVWHLKRKRHVVLFPEGTTGDGSRIRPFKPRLFAASTLAHTPIQPLAIRYPMPGSPRAVNDKVPFIGNMTFGPHLWAILGEQTIHAEIIFLPPIESIGAETRELARAAYTSICDFLQNPKSAAPTDSI